MKSLIEISKMEEELSEILKLMVVIVDLLKKSSEQTIAESMETQKDAVMREVLRQEVLKKCQEGLVLQMQELLESYNASCISEVKTEDVTSVLALVATFNKNGGEGGE